MTFGARKQAIVQLVRIMFYLSFFAITLVRMRSLISKEFLWTKNRSSKVYFCILSSRLGKYKELVDVNLSIQMPFSLIHSNVVKEFLSL